MRFITGFTEVKQFKADNTVRAIDRSRLARKTIKPKYEAATALRKDRKKVAVTFRYPNAGDAQAYGAIAHVNYRRPPARLDA